MNNSSETAPGNYEYTERNITGFSAIPISMWGGAFYPFGEAANFWSAESTGSSSTCWILDYDLKYFKKEDHIRRDAKSVRCLRD